MKNIFFICVCAMLVFSGCTDDDELYKNSGKNSGNEESTLPNEDIDPNLFEALNLDFPGLEQVKAWYETGNYYSAAKALLTYYKGRTGISNPNVSLLESTITPEQQLYADFAMDKYRFYVNTNYFENKDKKQPWSLQNTDKTINWEFKPAGADNEYQKQLHRHNWMPFQGKAYQKSGDEKYTLSWKEVYTDWIAKNPKPEGKPDEFKWWQLQVSTRIMGQTELFEYFKFSPNFTPEWLSFFLSHFAEHADYLAKYRYNDENNILLSQATALVFAGTLFPEFKNALEWQKMGCDILNEQAKKQFLADGMLGDLSLHYHIGILDEFYNLRRLIQMNSLPGNMLSPEIDNILLKATQVVTHFTYPNYFITNKNENCTSAFNDSWMKTRSVLNRNFKKYAEMFPNDAKLNYMATDGAMGTAPDTKIKVFEASGNYILRNGWTPESAMLIHSNNSSTNLSDWSHNQPDNGTFELYYNKRNFFPDSGVCAYMTESGDNSIRKWFRQTKAHNTMVLGKSEDNENTGAENIKYAKGKLLLAAEEGNQQLIVTENQGYDNFKHRRAIFFVKEPNFFVFIDEGFGEATGYPKLYFHLCDETAKDQVVLDSNASGAHTTFSDNNNLLIRSFGNKSITLKELEGRISYQTDRDDTKLRKAYSLVMNKSDNTPVRYITVLLPVESANSHTISAEFTDGQKDITKEVSIKVTIDGRQYNLNYKL